MAARKDQNIFTVIYPFYVALKLFGMFPASLDGKTQLGLFKVKCGDKISSLVALIVMLSMTMIHIFNPTKKFSESLLVLTGWQAR